MGVGGIGEPNRQFASVVFGLSHAFRQRLIPCLGLDHRQLCVAIHEHIVSRQCLAASSVAFEASQRDRVFTTNTACFNYAPNPRPRVRGRYVRLWFRLRSWVKPDDLKS